MILQIANKKNIFHRTMVLLNKLLDDVVFSENVENFRSKLTKFKLNKLVVSIV